MTPLRPLIAALITLTACGEATDNTPIAIEQVTQPGFASVNSWLLETSEGVVVIDAQRALSTGAMVADAVAATEKPLLAVIISHPHPDHFGGLTALLDRFPGAPVYASPTTQQVIATDSNGYQAATRQAIPEDSPEVFAVPNRTFTDGETLQFGELKLIVDEIGAGESETMTILHAPELSALFVSDLVAHRMTGFLLERRTGAWLEQIAAVQRDYGEAAPMIYPGHGSAGTFETLLTEQDAWLLDLRQLVRAKLEQGPLTPIGISEIEGEMQAKYPDYPIVAEIPALLALNIEAVAAELSAEN